MKIKEEFKNSGFGFLPLMNRWLLIKGLKDTDFITNILKQFGFTGDKLLSYCFVDHEQGLSLEVKKIVDVKNDMILLQDGPDAIGAKIILRYVNFIHFDVYPVPNEVITEKLWLPLVPEGMEIYHTPELAEIRTNDLLHQFRAEGFPDDIKILLPPIGDLKPEIIWGRVEKKDEYEDIFYCELINTPKQNFKVSKGELVEVVPTMVKDKPHLLCKTSFDRLKINK